MDTFQHKTPHSSWEVYAESGCYSNGRPAIVLQEAETGSRVAVATVNLPHADLEDDEVAIKNWSENEGMIETMVAAGYIERPHRTIPTGFVEADVCRLTEKGLALVEVSHA